MQFWVAPNSFIHLGGVSKFKQRYSILGNFKQLHSNLGNIQPLHLNLHTIRNNWANSNSLNHTWVIETSSFKLGYSRKYLGKLEEFHSNLHIL